MTNLNNIPASYSSPSADTSINEYELVDDFISIAEAESEISPASTSLEVMKWSKSLRKKQKEKRYKVWRRNR